ncbi:MAG: hypothetical protein IPP51_05425 [Bacteroidetes bacterium]|nr:hypothetical protein [Bacteroidota bacterium]
MKKATAFLWLITFLLFFASNSSAQTTYYWIGNGGSLTDPAHWALTSGGASCNCLPDINGNVVFDASSFTLSNQTISINSPQTLTFTKHFVCCDY